MHLPEKPPHIPDAVKIRGQNAGSLIGGQGWNASLGKLLNPWGPQFSNRC